MKDLPICGFAIDGIIAKVRLLIYWPQRGMRGHDERGETFWPLLWCDSSLMEPGPGWRRGVGLRTERAESFLWWPSQRSSRCAMKPYITILLYCVLLTISWLWRSLQTLGRSSRKPNPASWLQHGLCASERGTEKEKAVDIIPAASITITLLTNWKPKPHVLP